MFTVKDDEQIFLAAVSDAQWQTFCDALGFADLKADAVLATNNQRVELRPRLLTTLRERLAMRSADELSTLFENAGLPFAPIRKPEDLYDDRHLLATGSLADMRLPDGDKAGQTVKTTLFPITLAGQRLSAGAVLEIHDAGTRSYSIVASASSSNSRGILIPNAAAVFRLIVS